MIARGLEALTRHRRHEPVEFWSIAAWGVACTATHFTSMAFLLYSKIWWWDLFVHAASGFGVAGVLYVLRPGDARHPVALWLVLPLSVLAIGTWFEVYERLFTGFWVNWTLEFYWDDTLKDIVADTAGAVVFSVVLWVRLARSGSP